MVWAYSPMPFKDHGTISWEKYVSFTRLHQNVQ